MPYLHCDPPLHRLPPPFAYFPGKRVWTARNGSAACSAAQLFNVLGQDCRGSASQPGAVAARHGSCSVVHMVQQWAGFLQKASSAILATKPQ